MATIGNLNFAAAGPRRLAEFWCGALGYELQEAPAEFMKAWKEAGRDPDGAAAAIDPAGTGPRLFFIKTTARPKVPGTCTPLHLDLVCGDREAEVARLVALGASEVETKTRKTGEWVETWTVMEDPEGNGFCVQGP